VESQSSEPRRLKAACGLKQHFTLRMQPMSLAPPNAPGGCSAKPKDGQTLYLRPASLQSSSLEGILQRFAPKRKLDQTICVRCWPEPTSFYRYRQQSKELYDSLYVQLFAVIDECGRR
jgi:hypothetical protein